MQNENTKHPILYTASLLHESTSTRCLAVGRTLIYVHYCVVPIANACSQRFSATKHINGLFSKYGVIKV